MSLKTFVKISNVTNLSDARYCAGMGVDLIGFSIDPQSEYYVSPEKAVEIAEWLAGVEFVGEFHDGDINNLSAEIDKYPINYIEYSHPELTHAISALGYDMIFKTSIPDDLHDEGFMETLKFAGDHADYVLIDNIRDFASETILKELKKYCAHFPVILSGNFNSEDILNLLEQIPAKGIALKGSEEIKPGYKDFEALADILEVLEVDDLE